MASFLRRRILGEKTPTESREGTPETAEEVRLAPVSKIQYGKQKDSHKRRNGVVFLIGGLAGIVAAGLFAGKTDLIDFPELKDLSMDSLMDVLPAGVLKDARELSVSSDSI